MKRAFTRLTLGVLVVLAVAGLVMQAGSLSHVHDGDTAGFYNAEHDLTLLAGLAGHLLLVDAVPAIALPIVAALLMLCVCERPAFHLGRSGDSRAPPLR